MDNRRNSNTIDIRSFTGAYCAADYSLVVAKLGKDFQ